MSKHKPNKYKFALVEFINPLIGTDISTFWAMTNEFSVHLNDEVIFVDLEKGYPGAMWKGRVIRRTNAQVVEHSVLCRYEIIATANQFPVSDAPVQPELPVVHFPQIKLDRIQDAKSYLKDALEQLEKI